MLHNAMGEQTVNFDTVLQYVIRLNLLNCHAKFHCDTIEKMTLEVAIFGNFPDIPELKNCHFHRSIWTAGCDVE